MEAANKIFFNAGPTKLPREVLLKAQNELLDFQNSGISILETSHRSETYKNINSKAQNSLRELLSIPDDYEVLFMQGGATGIFSAIPMNITNNENDVGDYIVTGIWSRKAHKEAVNFCQASLVLPDGECCNGVPDRSTWKISKDAKFLYYCDNETVHGVEFPIVPENNSVPLVCDISSNILTRPIDISKFGVLFAGAQKNLGCAGVTIVIVRKDLIGQQRKHCPSILNWKTNADANSIFNTPPTFSIYIMSLVLDWVLENGGIPEMERRSIIKSSKLYDIIDSSEEFYCCPVEKESRSRVNVTFRIGGKDGNADLEKSFISKAKAEGIFGLEGHRSVGGIRASLYNAITIEETERLANFMTDFMASYKA